MRQEKISVVFPIFGDFARKRLFLAIESVKLQDYPNIEIIVSEQNSKPTYKKQAKKQGVKYIHFKPRKGKAMYNVGYVRNRGIKHASGKYVYLNDSDIVFLNKSFLTRLHKLLKESKAAYLAFPPMKRLILSQFDSFYEKVRNNGLKKEIENLSFPDGYTTYKGKTNKIKVVRYGYYRKKYTIPINDFKKITKDELKKYGYALLFFTFHAGGTFVEKKKLITVGGYCENFIGWAYDDVDLQVKLSQISKTRRISIPKRKSYEVLHLDHKNNFNKEKYNRNQKVFEERLKIDIKTLIREDKRKNKF